MLLGQYESKWNALTSIFTTTGNWKYRFLLLTELRTWSLSTYWASVRRHWANWISDPWSTSQLRFVLIFQLNYCSGWHANLSSGALSTASDDSVLTNLWDFLDVWRKKTKISLTSKRIVTAQSQALHGSHTMSTTSQKQDRIPHAAWAWSILCIRSWRLLWENINRSFQEENNANLVWHQYSGGVWLQERNLECLLCPSLNCSSPGCHLLAQRLFVCTWWAHCAAANRVHQLNREMSYDFTAVKFRTNSA